MTAPHTVHAAAADHARMVQSSRCTLDDLRGEAAASRLYAILDACDAPAVPLKCAEVGPERAACLYRGSAEASYWAIAPYLVAVDEELLEWIAAELWTEPWGIFVVSDADLEGVRRHFRRFLLVQAPDGEQWYFRFYDPRVLAVFLPTADAGQLHELFQEVSAFGVPSDEMPEVHLHAVISPPQPRRRVIRLRMG